MTDYLWDEEEGEQQREDTISYKRNKGNFFCQQNKWKRQRDRQKRVYY